MKHIRLITAMSSVFLFAAFAEGQATRTWVSGVGDDANPCSHTAPCKTFAGAISKTATNGEINCLDPGGFGAVTIIKSITIDCKGMTGGILGALTNGMIINGPGVVVKIRGVNINGAGNGLNGVKIISAAKVYVEDIVIDGFTLAGISAEGADTRVIVNNATIRNNTADGISSTGNAEVFVINSVVAGNGNGLRAGTGSTFRLTGSSVVANAAGLVSGGGKIVPVQNNLIDGNRKNGN